MKHINEIKFTIEELEKHRKDFEIEYNMSNLDVIAKYPILKHLFQDLYIASSYKLNKFCGQEVCEPRTILSSENVIKILMVLSSLGYNIKHEDGKFDNFNESVSTISFLNIGWFNHLSKIFKDIENDEIIASFDSIQRFIENAISENKKILEECKKSFLEKNV